MRKFSHLDVLDPTRPRRSRAPLIFLVALILVATPPLFELARLNAARFGLFGLTMPVETPILDAASAQWEYSHSECRDWIAPWLVNRRWNPNLVLPIAFVWTGLAALMLRRGH